MPASLGAGRRGAGGRAGGVVSVGNDWRYAEYAEGGFVPRVGINEPGPGPTTSTDAAGAAASAPPSGTQ